MAIENYKVGSKIGNYRLVEKLACGAFGCVYKAQHSIFDNRIVAIKLLQTRFATQKERDTFLHEAKLLEELKHTSILSIIDAGIEEGLPYLVTDYAPQGTLRDLIEKNAPHSLPLEKALSILSQVGQALQFAHDHRVVHRDLKPENMLFNAQGDAVLADFGIAEVLNTATYVMGVTGTAAYMSPEQFAGKARVQSDQYSLGCIAYELFTGLQPFEIHSIENAWYQHSKVAPTPPAQYNPNLPSNIEQAILKAMAKDRNLRYADVAAFIAALHKTAQQYVEPPPKQQSHRQVTPAPMTNEEMAELLKKEEAHNKEFFQTQQRDRLRVFIQALDRERDEVQAHFDQLRQDYTHNDTLLIEQLNRPEMLQELEKSCKTATTRFFTNFWHFLGRYVQLGPQSQNMIIPSLYEVSRLEKRERDEESGTLSDAIFSAMEGREQEWLLLIVQNAAKLADGMVFNVYYKCVETLRLNRRIPFRKIMQVLYKNDMLGLLQRELKDDIRFAELQRGPEIIEDWMRHAKEHGYDVEALMDTGSMAAWIKRWRNVFNGK